MTFTLDLISSPVPFPFEECEHAVWMHLCRKHGMGAVIDQALHLEAGMLILALRRAYNAAEVDYLREVAKRVVARWN
jgi:hypothetical protein